VGASRSPTSENVVIRQADGTTIVFHPDGSKELWHGAVLLMRFTQNGFPIPAG
jgi:hypothetical protein